MFQCRSGSEGPDGGPLSLDRDLRGGIGEEIGGHVAGVRVRLEVEFENVGYEREGLRRVTGSLGVFPRRRTVTVTVAEKVRKSVNSLEKLILGSVKK